jgi:hypothetical protein
MLGLHILTIRRRVSMLLRGLLGPAIGAARLAEVQLKVGDEDSAISVRESPTIAMRPFGMEGTLGSGARMSY